MILPTKNHAILLYPDKGSHITREEFMCLKRTMGIQDDSECSENPSPEWKYLECINDKWTFSDNSKRKPKIQFYEVIHPAVRSALLDGFTPLVEGNAVPFGELELITDQGVTLLGNGISERSTVGIGKILAYRKYTKLTTLSAPDILIAAGNHMKARANEYDKPKGERSIEATVKAFTAITGDGLMDTEERGWLFMGILKMVRSQQGDFKADNYEDGAAYFALQGEAAARARGKA